MQDKAFDNPKIRSSGTRRSSTSRIPRRGADGRRGSQPQDRRADDAPGGRTVLAIGHTPNTSPFTGQLRNGRRRLSDHPRRARGQTSRASSRAATCDHAYRQAITAAGRMLGESTLLKRTLEHWAERRRWGPEVRRKRRRSRWGHPGVRGRLRSARGGAPIKLLDLTRPGQDLEGSRTSAKSRRAGPRRTSRISQIQPPPPLLPHRRRHRLSRQKDRGCGRRIPRRCGRRRRRHGRRCVLRR
jgi:hypothetical protein